MPTFRPKPDPVERGSAPAWRKKGLGKPPSAGSWVRLNELGATLMRRLKPDYPYIDDGLRAVVDTVSKDLLIVSFPALGLSAEPGFIPCGEFSFSLNDELDLEILRNGLIYEPPASSLQLQGQEELVARLAESIYSARVGSSDSLNEQELASEAHYGFYAASVFLMVKEGLAGLNDSAEFMPMALENLTDWARLNAQPPDEGFPGEPFISVDEAAIGLLMGMRLRLAQFMASPSLGPEERERGAFLLAQLEAALSSKEHPDSSTDRGRASRQGRTVEGLISLARAVGGSDLAPILSTATARPSTIIVTAWGGETKEFRLEPVMSMGSQEDPQLDTQILGWETDPDGASDSAQTLIFMLLGAERVFLVYDGARSLDHVLGFIAKPSNAEARQFVRLSQTELERSRPRFAHLLIH